jgi:DNA-binding response OmpR family regulator
MKKYRAWVVEDDWDLAFICAEALRSAGFETEIIPNGAQALSRLAEDNPTLIVLDMHLPHVSGLNVLRQMHAELRLLDTRIIVATADTGLAPQLHDLADMVLIKPLTFSQIRDLSIQLVPSVQLLSKPGSPASVEKTAPSPRQPDSSTDR